MGEQSDTADSDQRADLAEARIRYREVHRAIERAGVGTIILNDGGIVLYSNSAAAGMLNRDRERIIGRRLGIPCSVGVTEITVVGADGRARFAEMSVEPTSWRKDKAYLVILHDINERKALYDELAASYQLIDETKRQLERSNGEFRDFAHTAAHDLKSPLSQVSQFTNALLKSEHANLSLQGRVFLQYIQKGGQRGIALVNRLLEYARADVTELKTSTVDLNAVVTSILQDYQSVISESAAQINVAELATLQGDALRVRQVFTNLIGNALKYRKVDCAPEITIKGRVLMPQEMCEVRIEDNGIGFEQQHAERVFEPFERLVSYQEFEGSGVGLATTHKIVMRMGGTIAANSEPGVGSVFTVTLPLQRRQPERSKEARRSKFATPAPQVNLKTLRVLIVDDNASDRELTRHLLSAFSTRCAGSAEAALQMLADEGADAVVSDCQMPGHDGHWLLAQLKKHYSTVRRFMVSHQAPMKLEGWLEDAVVEQFFEKPIDLEQFKRALLRVPGRFA